MSTTISGVSDEAEIECDHDLHFCLCDLDADASLFQPEQLRDRLIALDALDAQFGGFASEDLSRSGDLRTYKRAKALRARLEAVNTELYQSVRSAIAPGGQPGALFKWLQGLRLRLPRRPAQRCSSAARTERTEPSAISGDGALSANACAPYSPAVSIYRTCGG
jgi:hypothetical protein